MSETPTYNQSRSEWQTQHGFTLTADVAFQIMTDQAQILPEKLVKMPYVKARDIIEEGVEPAVTSLYIATQHLSRSIPSSDLLLRGLYGVTKEDTRRSKGHAEFAGMADMNFTWYFAPALARAAVDELVDASYLDRDDVAQWQLPEWADIIGTGWFSHLAHRMTIGRLGTYGIFGSLTESYKKDSLKDLLKRGLRMPDDAEVFETEEMIEPFENNKMYATVKPSKDLAQRLARARASGRESAGCPGARFVSMIPKDMVQTDPHTQSLLQNGWAELVPERSHDDTVRIRLEWSPLEVSLVALADKLHQYHNLYGTPYIKKDYTVYTIDHA